MNARDLRKLRERLHQTVDTVLEEFVEQQTKRARRPPTKRPEPVVASDLDRQLARKHMRRWGSIS